MPPTANSDEQKWTILVYMAGDNNLSDRCVDDLREMKMAGLGYEAIVKVQVDRASSSNNVASRYIIRGCDRQGTSDPRGALAADLQEFDMKQFNTGRKEALLDFIRWGLKDSGDNKVLLVLWGHATPLDEVPLPVPRRIRGSGRRRGRSSRFRASAEPSDAAAFFQLCPDDFTHDGLTEIELKDVLHDVNKDLGRKIDILGIDACLMSMVELGYELRQFAKFMVASQSLVPATSWPYHWILAALGLKPTMPAEELCEVIVDKYVAYYADYDDVDVELSACDLSRCDDVRDACVALNEKLLAGLGSDDFVLRNAVLAAHFRSQTYENQYCDLYDFCYMLAESCGSGYAEIKRSCVEVLNTLHDRKTNPFILKESSNANGSDDTFEYSYGTSVYFPVVFPRPNRYDHLEFGKDTKWIDFLGIYSDKISQFSREDREPESDFFPNPEVTPKEKPTKTSKSARRSAAAVVKT